jgi:hypothetical protein
MGLVPLVRPSLHVDHDRIAIGFNPTTKVSDPVPKLPVSGRHRSYRKFSKRIMSRLVASTFV